LNKFSARCVPKKLKIELATDNPIFGATGFVLVGAAPASRRAINLFESKAGNECLPVRIEPTGRAIGGVADIARMPPGVIRSTG
jgi:hypothetical protein